MLDPEELVKSFRNAFKEVVKAEIKAISPSRVLLKEYLCGRTKENVLFMLAKEVINESYPQYIDLIAKIEILK